MKSFLVVLFKLTFGIILGTIGGYLFATVLREIIGGKNIGIALDVNAISSMLFGIPAGIVVTTVGIFWLTGRDKDMDSL
jgi:hypothetical protein